MDLHASNPCIDTTCLETTIYELSKMFRYKNCTNEVDDFCNLLIQKVGSPTWIRTTINGSKGRCPTIRRSGSKAIAALPLFSLASKFDLSVRRGSFLRSPVGVRRTVERRLIRSAADVENARWICASANRGVLHDDFPGLVGTGYRILRNLAQVTIGN